MAVPAGDYKKVEGLEAGQLIQLREGLLRPLPNGFLLLECKLLLTIEELFDPICHHNLTGLLLDILLVIRDQRFLNHAFVSTEEIVHFCFLIPLQLINSLFVGVFDSGYFVHFVIEL